LQILLDRQDLVLLGLGTAATMAKVGQDKQDAADAVGDAAAEDRA